MVFLYVVCLTILLPAAVVRGQPAPAPRAENAEVEVDEVDDVESTVEAEPQPSEAERLLASLKDGDVSTLADQGGTLLMTYGPRLLGNVLISLLILVVGLIVTKWLSSMAGRAMRRARIEETLAGFLARMIRYALLILVLIMVLGVFGIPVTGFAAILAAAGFAIGMALSGTLGNFAAGMLLLIFRPFKVGDVIEIAGVSGKVAEIELFTTNLNTFDNRRLFVPNAEVYGGIIENKSHFLTRRVDVPVGVSYDADIDQTRQVLQTAIDSVAAVHAEPSPQVYLVDLGGSSVNWMLRCWTNTADFWPVREALVRAAKYKLDDAGIGIPYPQMDVHLDGGIKIQAEGSQAEGLAASGGR